MSAGYRSIGEVLSLLEDEHPDLTISKIRFLESQGLIAPQRTPSGYRKFFDADIERLNWVLVQQRDHYLPLKEIKRRLAAGMVPESELRGPATAPAAASATPSLFAKAQRADPDDGDDSGDGSDPDAVLEASVSLTASELARAVGTDSDHIAELQRLGLIAPVAARGAGDEEAVFDHDALLVARTALALAAHGLPMRSLRMFKVAADREAGVYEQLLGSVIARGDKARLRAEMSEVAGLAQSLHRLLLQRSLRPHLD